MMFLFNCSEYVVPWVGVLNQPGVWFFSRPSPSEKKDIFPENQGLESEFVLFFPGPFRKGEKFVHFLGRNFTTFFRKMFQPVISSLVRSQQVDQGTRFYALYYGEPSPQRFSEASGHKRPRVWSLMGRDIKGPYKWPAKKTIQFIATYCEWIFDNHQLQIQRKFQPPPQ